MVEILRLQDPVLATIAYLAPWFADAQPEVPPGWDYARPLVVVQDAGGTGERDVVLDDVMIHVRVYAPTQTQASQIARDVHGLLRRWPEEHSRVAWDGTIQRPTYDPDDETRTPGYSFTVRLIFRVETATVSP